MRSAADFLPQSAAQQLTRRLVMHQRLLDEVRRVLPAFLRNPCQACWLNRHGHLILQVSGQEYAAQIRFFLTAILDAIRKIADEKVVQVQIKTVIPKATTVVAATKTTVSPAIAQLIAHEACASHIPEIGAALGRLAGSMAKKQRGT